MNEKEYRVKNTTKTGEQEWLSKVFQQDDSPQNEEAEEGIKTKSMNGNFQKRIFSVNIFSKCHKCDFKNSNYKFFPSSMPQTRGI